MNHEFESNLGTTDWSNAGAGTSQKIPRGTVVGRYVIIEIIDSGGMGSVYRAYDPKLNRGVALKFLSLRHQDPDKAQRAKNRLIREAQALAQLSHPNVVAVHDVGSFDDDVFVAMELVDGKTLKDWLGNQNRTLAETVDLLIAAGQGLASAHKAGLIHRDFKPQNVIVGDDGRVRVLDFGLARAVDEEEPKPSQSADATEQEWQTSGSSSDNLLLSPLTKTGGFLGTPQYMAPEQHSGKNISERSDQFAFCLVLFEALYGQHPFPAKNLGDLRRRVTKEQIVFGPQAPTVPAWLQRIVRKGLKVDPAERYDSMDSLLADLKTDPNIRLNRRRSFLKRLTLILVLILLSIVVPIGLAGFWRHQTLQKCKSVQSTFLAVWDRQTKNKVRDAFLNSDQKNAADTWVRVEKTVDQYKHAWIDHREQVCEATWLQKTQSEELFDRRMICLSKRRKELKALVDVFVHADAKVVSRALQASQSLTSLTTCNSENARRERKRQPQHGFALARLEEIQDRLNRVKALSLTGKYAEGLTLVKEIAPIVSGEAYGPIQPDVYYALGDLYRKMGMYDKAEAALIESARLAGKNHNPRSAAMALASLTYIVGYPLARPQEGLALGRNASILLQLAEGDENIEAFLLNNLGVVLDEQGEYEKAKTHYEKAARIFEKIVGPKHIRYANCIDNLGLVYQVLGDLDKACTHHKQALLIRKNSLGPEHPAVATSFNNLGVALLMQGNLDLAWRRFEQALQIREKVLGPKHPYVALTLTNQAKVLLAQGLSSLSQQHLVRALAIYEHRLGKEHLVVADVFLQMGKLNIFSSNHRSARIRLQQSLAIMEKALGRDHPKLVEPLSGLVQVFADQQQTKSAQETFDRIEAVCDDKQCLQEPRYAAQFALAKALWSDNLKPQAKILVNSAQKGYASLPKRYAKQRKEIQVWITDSETSQRPD